METNENLISDSFDLKNLDSLDIYKDYLFVTAKNTDELLVFDKRTLILLQSIQKISGAPQFNKPNGIKIIDNLLFVTNVRQKKNGSLQIFTILELETGIKSFIKLKFLTQVNKLRMPYGIDVVKLPNPPMKNFYVYVIFLACNNFENNGEIIEYRLIVNFDSTIKELKLLKRNLPMNPKSYIHTLGFIESIKADFDNKKLFIADETNQIVYTFPLFSIRWDENKILFDGFNKKNDPEGIAISEKYIVLTQQGATAKETLFHVFDRNSLKHIGHFYGRNTKNTDGIVVDPETNYMYTIDDDRRVSKFNLNDIVEKLKKYHINTKEPYFETSQPIPNKFKISMVGDVMIGRTFNEYFRRDPKFDPFENKIRKHLNDSKLLIMNLETTLTNNIDKYPQKMFNYKLSPKYASILKNLSENVLCSLANNHILDFKRFGLIETIETLKSLGFKYTGAGLNISECQKLVTVSINNTTIGMLSASDNEKNWRANNTKEGIWYIDPSNQEMVNDAINIVRKSKIKCDILIFSCHMQPNYVSSINETIKIFYKKLVDNGVDIVHGHSPHHVLPIEKYKNGYICYSFGDFVDDYAIDPKYRNDLGILVDFQIFNGKITNYEIHSTIIKNLKVNFKNKFYLKQKFGNIKTQKNFKNIKINKQMNKSSQIKSSSYFNCKDEQITMYEWLLEIIPRYLYKMFKIVDPMIKKIKPFENIYPWTKIRNIFDLKILVNDTHFKRMISVFKCESGSKLNYFLKSYPLHFKSIPNFKHECGYKYPELPESLNEILISFRLNLLSTRQPYKKQEFPICKNFCKALYITSNIHRLGYAKSEELQKIFESDLYVFYEYFDESLDDYFETLFDELKKKPHDEKIIGFIKIFKILQIVLCQLFYAFYTSEIFNFRHNNLKLTNVMIHKFDTPKTLLFKFNEKVIIKIDDCPFLVKITDFDKSTMSAPTEHLINSNKERIELLNKLFNLVKFTNDEKTPRSDIYDFLKNFELRFLTPFIVNLFKIGQQVQTGVKLINRMSGADFRFMDDFIYRLEEYKIPVDLHEMFFNYGDFISRFGGFKNENHGFNEYYSKITKDMSFIRKYFVCKEDMEKVLMKSSIHPKDVYDMIFVFSRIKSIKENELINLKLCKINKEHERIKKKYNLPLKYNLGEDTKNLSSNKENEFKNESMYVKKEKDLKRDIFRIKFKILKLCNVENCIPGEINEMNKKNKIKILEGEKAKIIMQLYKMKEYKEIERGKYIKTFGRVSDAQPQFNSRDLQRFRNMQDTFLSSSHKERALKNECKRRFLLGDPSIEDKYYLREYDNLHSDQKFTDIKTGFSNIINTGKRFNEKNLKMFINALDSNKFEKFQELRKKHSNKELLSLDNNLLLKMAIKNKRFEFIDYLLKEKYVIKKLVKDFNLTRDLMKSVEYETKIQDNLKMNANKTKLKKRLNDLNAEGSHLYTIFYISILLNYHDIVKNLIKNSKNLGTLIYEDFLVILRFVIRCCEIPIIKIGILKFKNHPEYQGFKKAIMFIFKDEVMEPIYSFYKILTVSFSIKNFEVIDFLIDKIKSHEFFSDYYYLFMKIYDLSEAKHKTRILIHWLKYVFSQSEYERKFKEKEEFFQNKKDKTKRNINIKTQIKNGVQEGKEIDLKEYEKLYNESYKEDLEEFANEQVEKDLLYKYMNIIIKDALYNSKYKFELKKILEKRDIILTSLEALTMLKLFFNIGDSVIFGIIESKISEEEYEIPKRLQRKMLKNSLRIINDLRKKYRIISFEKHKKKIRNEFEHWKNIFNILLESKSMTDKEVVKKYDFLYKEFMKNNQKKSIKW